MNFLNYKFLILFIITFYSYWFVQNQYKRFLLILASCVFYSFFSFPFLLHLITILTINFLINKYFHQKTYFLKLSIGFNLSNLIFFKYFYFLLEMIGVIFNIPLLTEKVQLNQVVSGLLNLTHFEVILPATISYYTFQFISTSIDLRSQKITSPSYFDLASYVLFFPIMIAGPVTRLVEFKENFSNPEISKAKMYSGIWLILMGLIKKVLLSNSISNIIFPIFAEPEKYSGFSLLLNSYFFAINLYLDFSGLTDLARGFALLFGYELPTNFKAPFFLRGFGDFWRRWHISFSNWIRDYIYIPLGGSRVGEFRNYLNILITFSLGGLWHGSSFNFLLWGILTGTFISVERFLEIRNIRILKFKYSGLFKYLFVIHLYIITWNLFFTNSVKQAFEIILRIVKLEKGLPMIHIETGIYVILVSLIFHLQEEFPEKFERFKKTQVYLIPIISIIIILVMLNSSNRDFFYGDY